MGKKKTRKKRPWSKDDTEFTLLALPAAVWYFLFCYLPMFGVIIAFKDYRLSGNFIASVIRSPWTGLKNFSILFSNPDLMLIVRNTVLYSLVMISLGLVLSVALAIIVSELRNKLAAKVYQTILFFPHFLSWVVVATIVWAFLSYNLGMVNNTVYGEDIRAFHNWYTDRKFWPPFLIFMSQWKSLGYRTVIYLAAITSIDRTIYEAAIIDGATKWQQIWRITLPLIKRVVVLLFILAIGGIFRSDFGLFYEVPRDSNVLYNVVYTVDVLIYQLLRQSTVGMASAAALLQSALSCILILSANAIVRKVDNESAMM